MEPISPTFLRRCSRKSNISTLHGIFVYYVFCGFYFESHFGIQCVSNACASYEIMVDFFDIFAGLFRFFAIFSNLLYVNGKSLKKKIFGVVWRPCTLPHFHTCHAHQTDKCVSFNTFLLRNKNCHKPSCWYLHFLKTVNLYSKLFLPTKNCSTFASLFFQATFGQKAKQKQSVD